MPFTMKKKEGEEEDPLITLLKKARLAERKQNLPQADLMYHKVLDLIVDRGGSHEWDEWDEKKVLEARVYVYDCMANMYMRAMKLPQAEKLFKETMKGLLQQGLPQDDNAIVEISLKLAMICAMQDRNSEAEKGYKFCLETQEKKLESAAGGDHDENTLALLGMCVNSYSRYLLSQKRFDEALNHMKRSVDIAERVFGDEHAQVAVLYNDIATIMSMKGDHREALYYVNRAIKVATRANSDDLPTFYCNYGVLCFEHGDMNKARQFCKEALALAKKYNDKETQEEAKRCLKDIQAQQ